MFFFLPLLSFPSNLSCEGMLKNVERKEKKRPTTFYTIVDSRKSSLSHSLLRRTEAELHRRLVKDERNRLKFWLNYMGMKTPYHWAFIWIYFGKRVWSFWIAVNCVNTRSTEWKKYLNDWEYFGKMPLRDEWLMRSPSLSCDVEVERPTSRLLLAHSLDYCSMKTNAQKLAAKNSIDWLAFYLIILLLN